MAEALLAIDTATSHAVLALGTLADGQPLALADWPAGHAHAETLLPRLEGLLAQAGVALSSIGALVVGIGPGGFTGLRVGLATAKTLAHGLDRPIVGLGTALALAEAAGTPRPGAVVMPAGPRDRYLVTIDGDEPVQLLGPSAFEAWLATAGDMGSGLLAIDLDEPVIPPAARVRGRRAQEGLGTALLRLGAAALASGRRDDVAALVPAYVTLPRGVPAGVGEGTWSPDLR